MCDMKIYSKDTSYKLAPAGVKEKRYRYVGKEKDDETGLYYYGARYYAAWLCRFVSVDPLKDDYPQLNSYNYAGNKPITFKDIDGQQSPGDEKRNAQKDKKMPDSSNITFSETNEDGITTSQSITRTGDQIDIHNLQTDADGNVLSESFQSFDTKEFLRHLETIANPQSANDALAESAEGISLGGDGILNDSGSSTPPRDSFLIPDHSSGQTEFAQFEGELIDLTPPEITNETVPEAEDSEPLTDFDDTIYEEAEGVVGAFETGTAQAIKELDQIGKIASKGTKVFSRGIGGLGIIIPIASAGHEIYTTDQLKASSLIGIGLAIAATAATLSAAPIIAAALLIIGIALAIKGDDIIDSFLPAIPVPIFNNTRR